MRLFMYLRVNQNKPCLDKKSLYGQKIEILNWAKKNRHEIIDIFSDSPVSGFTGDRPSFDKMMRSALQNSDKIDGVVVSNYSRISRNNRYMLKAENTLNKTGLKLISVSEDFNEIPDLIKSIMSLDFNNAGSGMAKSWLAKVAEKGFYTGGVTPFGYKSVFSNKRDNGIKRKILKIHHIESKIIKKIYYLTIHATNEQGLVMKEIARYLNQHGLLKRKKLWTTYDVNHVLCNTVNYGEYQFKSHKDKNRVNIINVSVPAIITKEVFNEAQCNLMKQSDEK